MARNTVKTKFGHFFYDSTQTCTENGYLKKSRRNIAANYDVSQSYQLRLSQIC